MLFKEARERYFAALRVRTEDGHPIDWVLTQAHLALLKLELAEHDATSDPDKTPMAQPVFM